MYRDEAESWKEVSSGGLPSLERLEERVRAQEGSLSSFLVWPLATTVWNTGGSNH